MNRHTLRVLEFERIRRTVRDRLMTQEADSVMRVQRVLTEEQSLRQLKRSVQALKSMLLSPVRFPSLSFPAVHGSVERLAKTGVVLETSELAAIGQFASSVRDLGRYLSAAASETGEQQLLECLEEPPDLAQLIARITAILEPDGSVREREIPELKRLRSVITAAQQDLQKSAQSFVNDEATRRYFSTNVPTQRDGRTVLPVKADYRGKIEGIVHEFSSSGATVFVEPRPLVERNNALVAAENRYQNELHRILRELSDFCRERLVGVKQAISYAVEVDLIHARARYAIDFSCEQPEIAGDGLRLIEARHPLLGEAAVPISVEIPEGKRALIITGPNTGGKTVSLKTVGLLSLMHQFGLQIPASTGTELPVFSGVFADIGDEQSIEQNLSTFSGHMQNIGRILGSADERSLVLLDELGSGTDPEEGGALAMAVLDELLDKRPITIVTTHHGRLKHYGFTNERAANASVEFDTESLRPTYHIIPGLPGSSHAIEIAKQMGVLRRVTARAVDYLSDEEYDTGRIIRRLTEREQLLHRERGALADEKRAVADQAKALLEKDRAVAQERRELKSRRIRELDQWASETRSRLENLVRELREGELTRGKTHAVKQFISDLDEGLNQQREELTRQQGLLQAIEAPDIDSSSPLSPLSPGQEVRVTSTGARGVIGRRGKGSTWIVQLGAVKLPVEERDLQPIETRPEDTPRVTYRTSAGQPSLELDLRGYRLDEAVQAVEQNIDQALLGGLDRFGVIHGMGEGVLQNGVRAHLRDHPAVSAYEYAAPEDGGFGKTIVHL